MKPLLAELDQIPRFALLNSASCGLATATLGNGSWTLSLTGNPGGVSNPNDPEGSAQFPWTLTSTSTSVAITSVVLNGVLSGSCFAGNLGPGCVPGVVFDRDRATFAGADSLGQEGTPGGDFGITYKFNSEVLGPFTANVGYSNLVALTTSQACVGATFSGNNTGAGCHDSWGTLGFTFSGNAFQAGAAPAVWSFFQDTDNTVASAVPEPFTMGLMGVGLLALAALRKSRITKLV